MKLTTCTFGNRSFMKGCVFERPFVASPGLNFINLTILPLHFLLFHLTIGKNLERFGLLCLVLQIQLPQKQGQDDLGPVNTPSPDSRCLLVCCKGNAEALPCSNTLSIKIYKVLSVSVILWWALRSPTLLFCILFACCKRTSGGQYIQKISLEALV